MQIAKKMKGTIVTTLEAYIPASSGPGINRNRLCSFSRLCVPIISPSLPNCDLHSQFDHYLSKCKKQISDLYEEENFLHVTNLRFEKEGNERLQGWDEKFPINTNKEGTTSSFSKTSRTVVSFPIAFTNRTGTKLH